MPRRTPTALDVPNEVRITRGVDKLDIVWILSRFSSAHRGLGRQARILKGLAPKENVRNAAFGSATESR